VAAAVAVSAVAAARSPVLAFVVPAVVLVVVRRRSAARARRLEQRRREGVVELCAALAAELRAGQSATTALVQAARGTADAASLVASTLAVAETAGDVPSALRRDAAAPGAGALRRIAACWWVAGTAGTSMAPGLSRLARSLRAEEAHRRSVASALAAPRATARLLALLPAVAVLMGTGLGARPLDVLLGTPVGGLLLVAGLSLTAVGVAWTDRLASRAERAG
jgi:tight adherence protein B